MLNNFMFKFVLLSFSLMNLIICLCPLNQCNDGTNCITPDASHIALGDGLNCGFGCPIGKCINNDFICKDNDVDHLDNNGFCSTICNPKKCYDKNTFICQTPEDGKIYTGANFECGSKCDPEMCIKNDFTCDNSQDSQFSDGDGGKCISNCDGNRCIYGMNSSLFCTPTTATKIQDYTGHCNKYCSASEISCWNENFVLIKGLHHFPSI